jgi:hypothetical protein
MILAIAVAVGFVIAIVAAVRLNMLIGHASARFRVLAGGYGEAGLLVEARQRFRRRQQNVEKAFDTGTSGVQSAHRLVSGLFGKDASKAEGVYDNVRAFNRNIGRTISGLFAPGPKKRSESLGSWRKRHGGPDKPPADDDR